MELVIKLLLLAIGFYAVCFVAKDIMEPGIPREFIFYVSSFWCILCTITALVCMQKGMEDE